MTKLPRNITGEQIIKKLSKLGYEKTRQTGSHIRITREFKDVTHHITIPNHKPIKIGTLNNIIKDLAENMNISKDEVIKIIS